MKPRFRQRPADAQVSSARTQPFFLLPPPPPPSSPRVLRHAARAVAACRRGHGRLHGVEGRSRHAVIRKGARRRAVAASAGAVAWAARRVRARVGAARRVERLLLLRRRKVRHGDVVINNFADAPAAALVAGRKGRRARLAPPAHHEDGRDGNGGGGADADADRGGGAGGRRRHRAGRRVEQRRAK